MTHEQRSHFIRFCCACLIVRNPAMRSDGALTPKLFVAVGDVFEAMLGLWYWRLPEAGALRKHLGTRARFELSVMQRDLQRCKVVVGNIGRYARHIAAYA